MFVSLLIALPLVENLSAQIFSKPNSEVTEASDIFRVSIILFGVDDQTGNVLTYVKINNVTAAKLFNATKQELSDDDGIIETVISFPNETVATGANFTACIVILKDTTTSCKWGLNIPARTEVVQIVLPSYNK